LATARDRAAKTRDLRSLDRPWRMLVGGELVEADGRGTLPVENPATASQIAEIPAGQPADVDQAVEAADLAFTSWRRVPAAQRAEMVQQLTDAIERNGEELAWNDTVDNGSPVSVMRGHFRMAAEVLRREGPSPHG
jgi:betaine-aldehyde dehydrogenase